MISQRILNLFKEHNSIPKYKVEIIDIQNNEIDCKQESITLTVRQIYENGNVIERDLIIYSDIGLDYDGSFISVLNGYIGNEHESTVSTQEQSSHYIEVIDTVLQKTVNITFNQPYKTQPFYHVFIDDKYKSLYHETSQKYIKNENELYTGIEITFENLKTKQSYPNIGILIIGDEKQSLESDSGSLTITTYSLNDKQQMQYIEGANILIKDSNGNIKFNGQTGISGGIIVSLNYNQEYTIQATKEGYTSATNVLNFSKENNLLSILLEENENTIGDNDNENNTG